LVRDNTSLKNVNLIGNAFTSPEAGFALASAVRQNGRIEYLNNYPVQGLHNGMFPELKLSGVEPRLNDFDAHLVADLCANSAYLQRLDLSGNNLSYLGITAVVKVLPTLPAIQHVSLEDNQRLGREDVASLLSLLSGLQTSVGVNVWGLTLQTEEMPFVAAIFRNALREVHVDDVTITILRRVIGSTDMVHYLDMTGVPVPPHLARSLFSCVPAGFQLRIWGIDLTPDDFPDVMPFLQKSEVDIFAIAGVVGQRHGRSESRSPSPKGQRGRSQSPKGSRRPKTPSRSEREKDDGGTKGASRKKTSKVRIA